MLNRAMRNEPSNSDIIVDVRDIIARVEELEEQTEENEQGETKSTLDVEEEEELRILHNLLDELKGYGGDVQWRGDWYPITLIHDNHFEQFAEQFAEDIGAIQRDATWPNNCIDWEQAASDLQVDYSSVEWDGITYWYR